MSASKPHDGLQNPTSVDNSVAEPEVMTQSRATPRKHARHDPPEQAIPHVILPPLVKMFAEFPLDLLLEIVAYLRPLDITWLSRVNKMLRRLLMQRSAVRIWRTTLRNMDALPPIPTGLPEPLLTVLLFSPECTICGAYTSKSIDFVLQARLCQPCLNEHTIDIARISYPELLFVSPAPQADFPMWYSVCLRRDYEEVKSRYEALQTSGDTQALKVWAEGRLKAVRDRYECAALFSELFGAWKAKRQAKQRSASGLLEPSEYFKIREARLATIKARLTGMGWEIQEIEKLTAESKDWGNPLFTTEPLDDQAWEQILTYSLFHLESFRKLRRREERQPWLDDLFLQMQNRLGYLYYAPRKLDNEEHPPIPVLTNPSPAVVNHRENENVLPSFPHNEDILTICPELLPVLDIPSQEAFEAKLKTQDGYVEQAIHNWRDELELKLLSLLPEDTQPAELEGVDYKLMVGTTSQDARLLNLLPLGRAKLLRADAIFGWTQSELPHESCNLLYYPDDFWGTFKVTDKANLFYNPAAGYVAKALLRTIGLPNHSYLAMIGMHRKFQCGRCHDKSALTWRELLGHYMNDAVSYQISARGINTPFFFRHENDSVYPDKPLAHIVDSDANYQPPEINNAPSLNQDQFTCGLCIETSNLAGIYSEVGCIRYHVENVHLIDEPIEGVHYNRLASTSEESDSPT